MSTLFKKVTSAISVGAILASTVGTSIVAAASGFLPYAEALADAGIITKQSTEVGYRLADNALRQEVAGMMMALNKATYAADFSCAGNFSDVSATKPNSWVCKVVETALAKGLVASNSTFRPEDNITRAEALAMILRGQGIEIPTATGSSFNDVTVAWQVNVSEVALAKKFISSNASFRPNALVTRGELFVMAANAAGLEIASDDLNLDDLFGDDGTGSTNSGSTGATNTGVQLVGDVTLALNPASPASQSIPQAGTVTFAKYDVKAGGADVSLNSINLVREGLGSRSDFSRVWMEKNGVRVTGRQSIGSDGTVNVTFSPALVIKAGATESIDLVATLSGSSTGGQHKFTIVKNTDVVSSANVGGTFPLSTATMTTANYTVIPVTFAAKGSSSTYKVGDKSVELGQFSLYNGSTDDKSATFKSITLRNDGTGDAAKNLANLAVYKGNTKISSGVIFDSKNVTFAVSDTLAFGRTETYYIRADIDSVVNTTGDNYIFRLQNTDDLNVVENGTGFKATITGAATLSQYNVTGGDIIFSKSTGIASSQTIAPGANDVVLLSGDLKVAQAVNLQDMTLGFTSSTGVALQFTSFKLKIGSSVVSTFTPTSTSTTITFDGTFAVNATTTLQILGNVKSNAPTSTFVLSELNIYNAFAIKEYVSNGNSIQLAQIAGSTAGINSTIGQATLTLTRNDGIADQNLAVGSQGVTVMAFDMKANDVSDVTVTKLKFSTGTVSGTGINTANVNSVALYVNNTLVSTKSMSSGNADFNDINFTITKNGVANVKVVANFSTAIAGGEQLAIDLAQVDAKDSNGISLTDPSTQITVGPLYTFITSGSATFANVASQIPSNIVVPTSATGGVAIARITLSATDDDLQLTDLYLTTSGTTATLTNLGARAKFYLYDDKNVNFASPLAIGSATADTVSFNIGNNSTFIVPKNNVSGVTLVVYAVFNDVTDAADSNKTIILTNGVGGTTTPVTGTVNGVRLVSKSTGNNVATITGSGTSNAQLLARSKPTVSISGQGVSYHTVGITADANNNIQINSLTLSNVTLPAGVTYSYELYKSDTAAGNTQASNLLATGATLANGTITFGSAVEIAQGTTKYFYLSLTQSGTAAASSARTVKVSDVSYTDLLQTGGNVVISTVATYNNLGLPSSESRYQY